MTQVFKNTYKWFTDLSKLNQGLVIGGIALALIAIIALIIACVALHKAKNNRKVINNIVKTNKLKQDNVERKKI